MSDSFEQLISDMREMARLQDSLELDAFAWAYADRLEALVAELDPYLLPAYGQRGELPAEPSDDEPIYREVLGSEPAPGSDWVLIDPVTRNGKEAGES